MSLESNSPTPEQVCTHHWIVESDNKSQTCKKCGIFQEVKVPPIKFLNNFFNPLSRERQKKPERTGYETQMAELAMRLLRGENNREILDGFGMQPSSFTELRNRFINSFAKSTPNPRVSLHLAVQGAVEKKFVKDLDFLPNTNPEFDEEQLKCKDLLANGYVIQDLAEQLFISVKKATQLKSTVLEMVGVDNTYSLAGWVARERVRAQEARMNPTE